MKKLTRADTIAIWRDACKDRGIEIVVSSDIVETDVWRLATGMLSLCGMDPTEALRSRYVSLPGYILCPQKIGGRSHYDRVIQIGVLAHELTHHDQMEDVGGWFRWLNDYWRNKSNRAVYEGHAYGGDADIATYFCMTPMHPSNIFNAHFRKTYRVSIVQMTAGRKTYERQLDKLQRGRPSTKAASIIASELNARGYERQK